jgi:hypothetical protein
VAVNAHEIDLRKIGQFQTGLAAASVRGAFALRLLSQCRRGIDSDEG